MIPLLVFAFNACSQNSSSQHKKGMDGSFENTKLYPEAKPAAYWKENLSPEAYEIMVNRGTETPFKNPYWDNHKKGVYVSAATGKPLFSPEEKFDSDTGW